MQRERNRKETIFHNADCRVQIGKLAGCLAFAFFGLGDFDNGVLECNKGV